MMMNESDKDKALKEAEDIFRQIIEGSRWADDFSPVPSNAHKNTLLGAERLSEEWLNKWKQQLEKLNDTNE